MNNIGDIAFIIGTGRCGTSMIAQILNAHSKICVPHELQLIFEYSGNGPRLYEIFSSGENLCWHADDFIRKIGELCPHKFMEFFDYESFFHQRKYPINNLAGLLIDLFGEVAISKEKDIFIEQTPWYGQRLDIMDDLFPNAKYIHVIRDGRDVALSFSRTPWWHESPVDNLNRWQREVSRISHDATSLLNDHQYLEIKYEEFVFNPEREVSLILDFLGVQFEKEILLSENLIDYTLLRKSEVNSISSDGYNRWMTNKEHVVFPDNVYGWKKSNQDIFVNTSTEVIKTLAKYGYDT